MEHVGAYTSVIQSRDLEKALDRLHSIGPLLDFEGGNHCDPSPGLTATRTTQHFRQMIGVLCGITKGTILRSIG
jgi:hypothetical protein